METLVYHELRVYNEVSRKKRPLFYYKTPAGVEVDFIIETSRRTSANVPHIVAVEVKRADKWNTTWNKPLVSLGSASGVKADRLIGVYSGDRSYQFGAVEVMPYEKFCDLLHKGDLY